MPRIGDVGSQTRKSAAWMLQERKQSIIFAILILAAAGLPNASAAASENLSKIATKNSQITSLWAALDEHVANLTSSLKELRAEMAKKDEQIVNKFQQCSCWCNITITSVDHSDGAHGQYFNFFWSEGMESGAVVDVHHLRTGKEFEVVMWSSPNGGTVGDAHGRKDPESRGGDWQVGDVLWRKCHQVAKRCVGGECAARERDTLP